MTNPTGLKNNIAVGDTDWIDLSGHATPASVVIEGVTASDAVDIRVSNRPSQPARAEIGVIYGAAVTAPGIVKIMEPYRWLMIRRTTAAGTPAVVNAHLYSQRRPAT